MADSTCASTMFTKDSRGGSSAAIVMIGRDLRCAPAVPYSWPKIHVRRVDKGIRSSGPPRAADSLVAHAGRQRGPLKSLGQRDSRCKTYRLGLLEVKSARCGPACLVRQWFHWAPPPYSGWAVRVADPRVRSTGDEQALKERLEVPENVVGCHP